MGIMPTEVIDHGPLGHLNSDQAIKLRRMLLFVPKAGRVAEKTEKTLEDLRGRAMSCRVCYEMFEFAYIQDAEMGRRPQYKRPRGQKGSVS